MSQMLKFNHNEIDPLIEKIDNLTDNISDALSNADEDNQISTIRELYEKRGKVLLVLTKWADSEEGKKFIESNEELWTKVFGKISDKDNKNMKEFDKLVEGKREKLRKLHKQKSVLIYQKKDIPWI